MQFKRSALIAAIDKAITQENEATSAVHRRNEAAKKAQADEWLSLHANNWAKTATAIRAKLRRGEPVVETDIPRDGFTRQSFFRPARMEPLPPARTAELAGLRAVLEAVADDEISSSSLRSLGVGVNTLRLIVPLLGAAAVSADKTRTNQT